MATQTQIQREAMPGCIHEQICQAVYEQQRTRIQTLCQWMMPDRVQARHLALTVFVEAWRQPGQAWPAVSGDNLARNFAARFWRLFHNDAGADSPQAREGQTPPAPAMDPRPQLVSARQPVRDAVTALPSAHRLLYLLHELEGYSAAQLAAWLDLEPSRCAHMIHEARLQLRRNLLAA